MMMRDTVAIKVELFQDEGRYFVASSDDLGLVTDGKTFEELLHNLREALALCLEDAADLGFSPHPHVVIRIDLPDCVDSRVRKSSRYWSSSVLQ
jgi:predicted RNase H-like HicB family nuclease